MSVQTLRPVNSYARIPRGVTTATVPRDTGWLPMVCAMVGSQYYFISREIRHGTLYLRHSSLEIRHGNLEIRHSSLEIRHGSLEIRHYSLEISHQSRN